MGRYARAIYGEGKYGLDLRSEHSVEPMLATIEIDPLAEPVAARAGISTFTDSRGRAVYDRVQVSWLPPLGVQRFVLLRSNTGYPTGPTDPYASALIDSASDPAPPEPTVVRNLPGDPRNRKRVALIDISVEQGREYFYAVWCMTGSVEDNTDVWHLSGRASVTTSIDHGFLDAFKSALPAYMWNRYSGPGAGVAVDADPDDENTITRWLQCTAWELDKIMTKADGVRKIWDPQHTPAVLLDEATSMFGLPNEPALGSRAARALLQNAAAITGGRGTLESISLLVESLSGFRCDLTVGTNILGNTDESSFEGLMLDSAGNVTGGTGRWYISGANISRIPGDQNNSTTRIARDPNPEELVSPGTRFALGLAPAIVGGSVSLSLGERIRVTHLKTGAKYGVATTAWPHGLEAGDEVSYATPGASLPISGVTPIDDFRIQFVVPTALADLDEDVADGWLEGGPIPAHQGVPVEPGSNYSLVGMFTADDSEDVELTLKYWDRRGGYLGATTASPDAPVPGEWTRVSASGSTPAEAFSATLEITGKMTGVDSLMVRQGGTRYDGVVDGVPLAFDSSTPFDGDMDYTFEDAQILTLTFDTSHTPTGGSIPFTIHADMVEVLRARLTDILTQYLPIGTGFRIVGLEP